MFNICARDVNGVITASKHITEFNSIWDHDFKYMIDTKVNNNYGFNPDATAGLSNDSSYPSPSHEIIFEEPIPFNSIVGYFKEFDTTTFYMNNKYTGNFNWTAKNIVENYQSKNWSINKQTQCLPNFSCTIC